MSWSAAVPIGVPCVRRGAPRPASVKTLCSVVPNCALSPMASKARTIPDTVCRNSGMSGTLRVAVMSFSENAIVPPGRTNVLSRRRVVAGSGKCIRINRPTIASTGSSTVSESTLDCLKCTVVKPCSEARALARATISGAASTPSTVPVGPTSRAATNDTSPGPHPISSTRMPGRSPAIRSACSVWSLYSRPCRSSRRTSTSSWPRT